MTRIDPSAALAALARLRAAGVPQDGAAPYAADEAAARSRSPHTKAQGTVATEHAEQAALIDWCAGQAPRIPELGLLYAIPNGGARDVRVAVQLKAEGVQAGIPDLHLPVARGGWHSLYLELKRTRGGRVEPEQAAWHAALLAQGNDVRVCRGWVEAATVLLIYLGRRPEEYL